MLIYDLITLSEICMWNNTISLNIVDIINEFWPAITVELLKIAGAIVALIVGWLLGRLLGLVVSSFIHRSKLENLWGKTSLGTAIRQSGLSISKIAEYVAKWTVYLLSILVAVDILDIEVLRPIMNAIIGYIPNFVGGIVVFLVGFLIVDLLSGIITNAIKGSGYKYHAIAENGFRLLGYFVVITTTLTIMKVDVSIFHILANALALGLAIGIAVGLGIAFGWGLKDIVAKNAAKWFTGLRTTANEVEKSMEVRSLQEKIKELEEDLRVHKLKLDSFEAIKKHKLDALNMPIQDLTSWLTETVGDKGQIVTAYGGYTIEVVDEISFPWYEVLISLMANGQEVWLSKREGKFIIKSTLHTE